MATPSDEMNKELNFRRYEDYPREEFGRFYDNDEMIWQASWTHKCPTYVHQTPPCQASCPSGHDVRGWLDIVRGLDTPPEGVTMEEHAFRLYTEANPFPSTMGRVCPAPCQDGCNRNEVEDFVGINSIDQFIGDSALESDLGFESGEDSGKKVAIIGGGPAGLAAAYQLRKIGHGATIFDDHDTLGGMMVYGIPGYRTPREMLAGEVKRITDMGVELRLNTRVGTDISVEDIEKEFDAVFWAIGAQSGRPLPIDGAEAPNCITGVAFLSAFNSGRLKHVSGKVVVVGGGDTSIDVASVARRIGHIDTPHDNDRPEHIIMGDTAHDVADTAAREGAEVLLISRQPIENMSAAQHEIDDALREGVEIRGSLSPVEVVLDADGRATGLKVVQLSYESGKAEPIEGTEEILECSLIASAIGQTGDFTGYEDLDNGRGLIDATKNYAVKGKPGHFVAGDIIRPHLLTTAIGQASVAVESINEYLKGEELSVRPKVDVHHFQLGDQLQRAGLEPENFAPEGDGREKEDGLRGTDSSKFAIHNYEDRSFASVITHEKLFLGHFENSPRNHRSFKEVDAEVVLQNFEERMVGLDKDTAVAEAKRCMSCGMCFECDNCVIFCPQQAVFKVRKNESAMGRYVDTDYSKCVGCNICEDVCPTGYIQMGLGE
ncbi:MAG: FAD-dependent oxidoreductase [Gammaproteobacteria bacterium]|uniref:FAD-dependent oxidoreductase n=1 Tax=Candidatus Thiopontia autotrophica TaxID=2841688 RepID=A0A8J6P9F5_9GAMM|nr:FAD-dependent oxidoreductase [Candidatus Thiopontia autotrophica]MBL6969198.1 FAD-dependent oxidoreductase [Gammaproteobacteria bacterium]